MEKIDPKVKFFVNLGKAHSILSGRFDRGLGGLGWSEFLILFHLDQAEAGSMRRVDLAGKVGMTASGITRQLLPMEKVHLVKSGPVEKDARVRTVALAAGGREKLTEALERLEFLAGEIIPDGQAKAIAEMSDLLLELGGRAMMA